MKNRFLVCIVILQVLLLGVAFKVFCSGTYDSYSVMDNMVSNNITQQDDGTWYIDEKSGINSSTIFLYGPYISLNEGSYSIAIEYETNENQIMDIHSKNNSAYLFSNSWNRQMSSSGMRQVVLKNGNNSEYIKIRATQSIDDFEIRLYYSGKGYVKVSDISIVRNNEEQKGNILLAAIVMIILDICIYFGAIKRSGYFLKLCPIIAGVVTGVSLSIRGEVCESPSFISILYNECNGIGVDKLIVCIAVIYFFKKQWHLLYEIKSYIIKILAILFSVFMVIGISFSSNGSLIFIKGNFPQFIVSVLVFIGYYCLFMVSITFLFKKLDVVNVSGSLFKIDFIEKHYFVFAVIAIMAGWFPYIAIFLPGSVPWDGRWQISEGVGYSTLSNHHPWIVSKFMGLLMQLGQLISDNTGVFFIVAVFMVIEALCYGFVCCKVKKYMGKYMFFISILYFALMPAFAAFSCVVLKDGLNAAFAAYFTAIYIDCCMKANQQRLSIKDFVWLGISALLVCITRKNGIYLVLPQCLCLAVWVVKRKQILGVVFLSISILAGQVITDIKLPEYLGIVEGSEKEMLSIPFQQTARYLVYFPEDVTVEEQEAIDAVLPFDQIATAYYPEKSDSVKNRYKKAAGSEELKNYFKSWFSMFKKHPEIYLEATLEGSYGYLYPFRNCSASERYYLYIDPAKNGSMYWHYLFSNEVRSRMEAYADLWVSVPILSQLMNPGTYTWLLLMLVAYMIYKKRTKGILMYVASFMNILVCIASPVNGLLRYTLPVMACMPLLIGWSYHYCKYFDENL